MEIHTHAKRPGCVGHCATGRAAAPHGSALGWHIQQQLRGIRPAAGEGACAVGQGLTHRTVADDTDLFPLQEERGPERPRAAETPLPGSCTVHPGGSPGGLARAPSQQGEPPGVSHSGPSGVALSPLSSSRDGLLGQSGAQAWYLSVGPPALWVEVAGLSLPTHTSCGVMSSRPSLGRPRPSAICAGGGVGTAVAPRVWATPRCPRVLAGPHCHHRRLPAGSVSGGGQAVRRQEEAFVPRLMWAPPPAVPVSPAGRLLGGASTA